MSSGPEYPHRTLVRQKTLRFLSDAQPSPHASLVAREYGIPAVVGTGWADEVALTSPVGQSGLQQGVPGNGIGGYDLAGASDRFARVGRCWWAWPSVG